MVAELKWIDWSFKGNIASPPDYQLEADVYAKAKKTLNDNLGKWKGGKKQHFEFPFPVEDLGRRLVAGENPSMKRDLHYFPTTKEAADNMFNCIMPVEPVKVLEPSAGQGAILDLWGEWAQYAKENSTIHCVELHDGNVAELKRKGYEVVGRDFDNFNTDERYELILANPPFKHTVRHVRRMAGLVCKGGCIAVILPSNFGDSKSERELMGELESQFDAVHSGPIMRGAFKQSGTSISVKTVYCTYSRVRGELDV